MLFNNHYHFFKRCIAGPLAQTIDGTFYLPCPGHNTCNGICCCQTKIIMTMTGDDRFVNI